MDLESKYHKSQVNGTIYVTTRQELDKDLQESLEMGAGEVCFQVVFGDAWC